MGEVEYYWLNITQPGIKLVPPEAEVWGLNHWTTREGPILVYFNKKQMFSNLVNITERETDSQIWRANQWGEGSGEGQETDRGFQGTTLCIK